MSNLFTIACRPVRLPPTQKAVLMCLADHCHDDGRDWHSAAAIMVWTCLGRRTVIDALQALEARGLIQIERTRGQRNRTSLQIERIEGQTDAADQPNQCSSRTRAGAAPVHEPHGTCAGAALPPVQEPHYPVQEPHPKHQEAIEKHQKAKTRKRVAAVEVLPDSALPEWLPIAAWRSFVDARALMRKPMSLNAQEIAVKRLTKFRAAGHDVEAILESSVMNGWQGLFAPSESRHAAASVNSDDKPAWALRAGFKTRFDAENDGCNERNAGQFRAGKRLENA